ncbi:MAG: c-type cytochrome [Acidobacteriota bacterium]
MIEQYVDAAELRRLLSALLVVVGVILLACLFAVIVVPGLRNANRPAAAPAVPVVGGETGWLDPAEYPPARGYDVPPVRPEEVLSATPALLARGRALFEQNCRSCHGPEGRGDGPAAQGLAPPPRDFASPQGWKNGPGIPEIYRTLEKGIPGSSMGAYDYLPAKDRMALVHYVQSLGSFSHGDVPEALEAFGRQFATAGERVPNKIPVTLAAARLREEFRPPEPLRAEGPGAEILREEAWDLARVALALQGAQTWRKSPAALAEHVLPSVPENGFRPRVAACSAEEWTILHAALLAAVDRDEKGGGEGGKRS